MRLDHIAYRVKNRMETAKFLCAAFGYRIDPELPEGFQIKFEDGTTTDCLVLLPPEKIQEDLVWKLGIAEVLSGQEFHLAPEIFVSDGVPGSIVGQWVSRTNNGAGGIHHLAYQVDSVKKTMEEMLSKELASFTTDEPIICEGLEQVFTKPSPFTGIIYEFISRGKQGFCQSSVKHLMQSTRDFS